MNYDLHSNGYSVNCRMMGELMRENHIACACLLFFCDNMDENNTFACNDDDLRKECSMNPKTIAKTIQLLIDRNLVTVHEADGLKVYTVNRNFAGLP